MSAEAYLARIRAICLSLPEIEERLSHGSPTWFIRGKKSIGSFVDHHHGDPRVAIWIPAAPGMQEALIQADPVMFYRPPYVGPAGWIAVNLDAVKDWDEVEGLLVEAYRLVGPKKLVALIEGR
ncbi:MAG: MmcQ/YjbR family DNA-binding protein [Armatimonadetes bacterium]|nr:MmcQ/YjbR family DNA-binding protein [Armatimonadota bacterium]